MSDEELNQLERLTNAATPGPWKATYESVLHAPGDVLVAGMWYYDEGGIQFPEDAAFIAAARDAVPKLIAELRELRKWYDDACVASDDMNLSD